MSEYDDLIGQVPITQLARRFDVDAARMREAVEAAVPALVGGMQANAADPAGARSLATALGDHSGPVPHDVTKVDEADGEKIVGHVFGGRTDDVVVRLGGSGGGLVGRLLPVLAPIVLSWLAGRLRGPDGTGGASGGLGDVIGDVFGGDGPAPAPPRHDIDDGPLFPGGEGADDGPVRMPTRGTPGTTTPADETPATGADPLQDLLGKVLGGTGGDLLGGLGDLLGRGRR